MVVVVDLFSNFRTSLTLVLGSKADSWLIRGVYHSTWAALTLCVLNN